MADVYEKIGEQFVKTTDEERKKNVLEYKNIKVSVYLTEQQALNLKKIATKMNENVVSPVKLSDFTRGIIHNFICEHEHLL
jgi:hypothetical protein